MVAIEDITTGSPSKSKAGATGVDAASSSDSQPVSLGEAQAAKAAASPKSKKKKQPATPAAAPAAAPAAGTAVAAAGDAGEEAPNFGQVARQMVMLPVLWTSSKVDWTEPFAEKSLVFAGMLVVLLCMAVLQLCLLRIARKADRGRVAEPGDSQFYTKDSDGSVSVMDYDQAKVKEARMQLVMTVLIGAFVFYQWKYVQPILIMCVMQPMQLYDNKLVHIHVLGKDHPRPFAAPKGNPLQEWADRKKKEAEEAAKAAKKQE